MKREKQHTCQHRPKSGARPQGVGGGLDPEATDADRVSHDRAEMLERQPPRTSDARAIRELVGAAPTDLALSRRATRRNELRQIVVPIIGKPINLCGEDGRRIPNVIDGTRLPSQSAVMPSSAPTKG